MHGGAGRAARHSAIQAAQMLGAAEHRSAHPLMRRRDAQAATTQMGRMGAEGPPIRAGAAMP
jgi:hypothetical protein